MKKLLISIFSFTVLTASTWQNIQSAEATKTTLDLVSSNVNQTVVDFTIDGFHMVPVMTPTAASGGACRSTTGSGGEPPPKLSNCSRASVIGNHGALCSEPVKM